VRFEVLVLVIYSRGLWQRASNDFKAIAAQKRLLPDSKYRNLPLENAPLIARGLSLGNRRPGTRFFATRKNVAFLVVGRANI